jgi:RNA polymerase-associated protein RTF1
MLARKNQINSTKHSAAWLTMEKSRLNQARTLAYRRQDYAEMATIDTQLAELTASMPVTQVREDDKTDILAKVNERNRKANVEAVRKAEQMEADRKRRERRLAAAARASSSPAPSTLAVKNGISRFVSAANAPNVLAHPFARSRPATPSVNGKPTAGTSPTSALSKVKAVEISFEASIAAVEVDLGDF